MKRVALVLGLSLGTAVGAASANLRAVPVAPMRAPPLPVVATAARSTHEAPAVAVKVPVVPVVAVSTNATQTMELAVQAMAMHLMRFLLDQSGMPTYQLWLPRCIDHTKRITRRVDLSYTDLQLRQLLLEQCSNNQVFPTSREDGFDSENACRDFADNLVVAREMEQEGKGSVGYELFCKRYYDHKNGKPKPKTTPPTKAEEVAEPIPENIPEKSAFERFFESLMKYFPWLVVLAILCCCFGLFAARRKKKEGLPMMNHEQSLTADRAGPVLFNPLYDANEMACSAAWNTRKRAWGVEGVDIDVSCFVYNRSGGLKNVVYFGKTTDESDGICLTADNLTGDIPRSDGASDSEKILFRTGTLQSNVQCLIFTAHIFTQGANFSNVNGFGVRVVDTAAQKELAKYDKSAAMDGNALVVAMIYRRGDHWAFLPIDESYHIASHSISTTLDTNGTLRRYVERALREHEQEMRSGDH